MLILRQPYDALLERCHQEAERILAKAHIETQSAPNACLQLGPLRWACRLHLPFPLSQRRWLIGGTSTEQWYTARWSAAVSSSATEYSLTME
jgi:hypothetical protein